MQVKDAIAEKNYAQAQILTILRDLEASTGTRVESILINHSYTVLDQNIVEVRIGLKL